MDYTIFYPTKLGQINPLTGKPDIDPKNDNMDVCVTFADGRSYTFVFATPQNISTLMKRDGRGYYRPGLPFLFVEELTEENIEACIADIAEDKAMLNLHGGDILDLLEGWEPPRDAE